MHKDSFVEDRNRIATSLLTEITASGLISKLKVTGVDGNKPIVIAFEDESVGDVFTRVSWSGGFANLFIVRNIFDTKFEVELASITPPESSIKVRETEPIVTVDSRSPIGMLAQLAQHQKNYVAFNIKFSGVTMKVRSFEAVQELVNV